MTPSNTHTPEFEQTATSRLAHRMFSSDQHGTTVAVEVGQIDRPPNLRIDHPMSTTRRAVARKELHAAIMFLITTLGSYLGVEYQSRMKSPFDDHATLMAAICVFLCFYALSLIAEFTLQSEDPYLAIITTFGPLLGFLVPVLLLIILVPLLGIIASIIWALFLLKAATTSYSMIMKCLGQVLSCIRIRRWLVSDQSHRSQEEHANASSPAQSQAESNV